MNTLGTVIKDILKIYNQFYEDEIHGLRFKKTLNETGVIVDASKKLVK